MKNLLTLTLLAFLTLACSEKRSVATRSANSPEQTSPATATDSSAQTGKKTGSITRTVAKKHIFSDPTNPDEFKLQLNGNSLLNSNIHFTITNAAGKVIYLDSLTTADLEASLVYELKTPQATVNQREAFVQKRIDSFFDEKNFSTPAIAPNDSYSPAFGDETAWNAIKNDKNAVGFNFLVGKENGRRIAFSKLKKAVMLVGNFGG